MTARTTIPAPAPGPDNPAAALNIRMAVPADAPALRRLAELDSAPPPDPDPGPTLVAEVGGEMRAALSLEGGSVIANPFRRTAELVAMLAARGAQLRTPTAAPAKRRWPSVRSAELAPSRRPDRIPATAEAQH